MVHGVPPQESTFLPPVSSRRWNFFADIVSAVERGRDLYRAWHKPRETCAENILLTFPRGTQKGVIIALNKTTLRC